nr:hypothetical protein [Tanacetum cinerariifolium]
MPTKIDLKLEQSQQDVSNDVFVSIEEVEELKRNTRHHGPSDAMHNPSHPFEFLSTETSLILLGLYNKSSRDKESLGEDASKQERRIDAIDQDEDITLVNVQEDAEMFDVNDLGGQEVFVAKQEVVKDVNANIVEEVVNATQDSIATTTITTKEITLVKALKDLKTSKPKVKGIDIQEQEEPEPVKPKKKDQIRLDEEAALKLQAEFNEEER